MHIQNENERERELLEEEERKKREQPEELPKAKQKTKQALHEQLKEQEKLETVQLTEGLKDSRKNLQGVKVARVMSTTGNDRLNDAAKQLVMIKQQKEKILDKLCKQETAKDSEVR